MELAEKAGEDQPKREVLRGVQIEGDSYVDGGRGSGTWKREGEGESGMKSRKGKVRRELGGLNYGTARKIASENGKMMSERCEACD